MALIKVATEVASQCQVEELPTLEPCVQTGQDVLQGFWDQFLLPLSSQGQIQGYCMSRWTREEIIEYGFCPGCACEVTSTKCFACEYDKLNSLESDTEKVMRLLYEQKQETRSSNIDKHDNAGLNSLACSGPVGLDTMT